jgi:RNA polymerase sigma-70 factor (sigma-E family)
VYASGGVDPEGAGAGVGAAHYDRLTGGRTDISTGARASAWVTTDGRCAVNPLVSLDDFCEEQHPRLVASVAAYCGDPDQAEEIAQDALVRACDHWDELREMDAPGAWLHRVARNLTASHYRRRRTRQRIYEQIAEPDTWHTDPDTPAVVAVRRALELLPPRQRAAVTLRYLDDWAVADVADALGCSEDAVKSLTYRGLNRLRHHFNENAPEPSGRTAATATIAITALVFLVSLVAGIRLAPPVVYVEPVPPPDVEPWSTPSRATVSGDLRDTVVLDRLDAAQRGDVMTGQYDERIRLVLRAPGRASLIINGQMGQHARTSPDLQLTFVHGADIFRSQAGECAITLGQFGHTRTSPLPATTPPFVITGTITCIGLQASTAQVTVDLDVTIRHVIDATRPR